MHFDGQSVSEKDVDWRNLISNSVSNCCVGMSIAGVILSSRTANHSARVDLGSGFCAHARAILISESTVCHFVLPSFLSIDTEIPAN